MKKFFVTLMASLMIAIAVLLLTVPTGAYAEDATTTATTSTDTSTATTTNTSAAKFGILSMGLDNLYLAEPGESAFLAVGAGIDIVQYEKSIGSKGGKLSLTLHTTAAARVTGNDSSTLVGGSVNLDLVKLFNGSGINFLLNNFKCVIGPAVVYDASKGKPAYGGLLNFSYTTD